MHVGSVLVAPDEIVGITEVAELLGVGFRTATRCAHRDDFPAPLGTLARGRVWRRADVEAWAERLPLRTGRPPKPQEGE